MSSEAVAVMSRKWAMRMGLVTLAFLGFAVWCIYDANVTYPRFNRRARAYNELIRADNEDAWQALARENGWKTAFDTTDKNQDGTVILKSSWDIGTQYVMLAMCLVVGAFTGGRILIARNKSMQVDERGFRTIEGERIPYENIERLDMSRWQKKSIVTVHYRSQGVGKTTRIDDWIYQGGETILREIQKHTGLGPEPAKETAPRNDAAESDRQTAAANGDSGDENRANG